MILPGEGESVFIKGVASGQSIMQREMALHPSGCGQHTPDSVQRTEKGHMELNEDDLGEDGRGL